MNEAYARMALADTCHMLYDRNLTVSAGGNMSVRLDDEYILITPSGRNKGTLAPEDMIVVSMDGEALGDEKPSIETGMHLGIYRNNPDAGAVVHCHVRTDLTPEGVLLLGDVPTVGYMTPGTKELADAVAAHAASKAILLTRHGAVTVGRDLQQAFDRMEELEFQARLQMLVGRCRGLPKAEVEKLRGM